MSFESRIKIGTETAANRRRKSKEGIPQSLTLWNSLSFDFQNFKKIYGRRIFP